MSVGDQVITPATRFEPDKPVVEMVEPLIDVDLLNVISLKTHLSVSA